jgi:hypothetical protein
MLGSLPRATLPALLLMASALLAGPTSTTVEAHAPLVVGLGPPEPCGGLAPFVVACTTGTHTVQGSPIQGIGTPAGSPAYTGTVESILQHPAGNRVFRCSYDGGASVGCTNNGYVAWPPGPQTITHRCVSYDLGTSDRGGQGPWACHIQHG